MEHTCPYCGGYSKYGYLHKRCSVEWQRDDPGGYRAYNKGCGCGAIPLPIIVLLVVGFGLRQCDSSKKAVEQTPPEIHRTESTPDANISSSPTPKSIVRLRNGKTFTNPKFKRITDGTIVITHDAGVYRAKSEELDQETLRSIEGNK